MKALVVSRNLIGDALYIQMAVKRWQEAHPDWQLDLLTSKDHVTVLYYGMGIRWDNIFFEDSDATDASNYDSKFLLGAGDAGVLCEKKRGHIAEGYAEMMGVTLTEPFIPTEHGMFRAIHPYFDPITALEYARDGEPMRRKDAEGWAREVADENPESCVLWSPFSASCTSQEKDKDGNLRGLTPNKMLPTMAWIDSIEFMRSLGPLRLLGSSREVVPPEWKLTMDETSLLGLPLAETALVMRQSKLVVTVDNGMGHLVASQDANHILFYPMCLGMHFIIPWGANFTVPVHMEPIRMNSAMTVRIIERSLPRLERQRRQQERRINSGGK